MGSHGTQGDPMFGVIGILLLLAWIANNALGLDPRVPQWALWIFAGGCLGFDFVRSQFPTGDRQMAVASIPAGTQPRSRRV